ncbi:Pre-mRNA-splicing factor of RES complex-domain-containing protein [Morchella snyderi]|nr:Pre-mRNA-splicing factor of RES complex-domain-containing protein [Morchella snyderi]
MSLSTYLAQKYLTKDEPDKKKSKKRKRKAQQEGGVIIADDDALGWDQGIDDDDDDGPVTIGETTKAFRRTTKSNWTSVDADAAETAAADAIIAQAPPQADDPDDQPAIVGADDKSMQKMSSGAHAGLQTAAQVTAQLEQQRKAELARFNAQDPRETGKGQETIYRDASGRIINIAMARQEARKKLEEEEAKKRHVVEQNKGELQAVQREERKKELEEAKYMTLARYADDKELNEEMKEKELWNDPAAAFLTNKKKGLSKTGRPLYKGAAPPNRYHILPGHRWDGVDRGNGFEKKWFQAQNVRKNRAQLEHDWQTDM